MATSTKKAVPPCKDLRLAAFHIWKAIQAFEAVVAQLEEAAFREDSSSVAASHAVVDTVSALSPVGIYLHEGGQFTSEEFVRWVHDSADVVERIMADPPLAMTHAG